MQFGGRAALSVWVLSAVWLVLAATPGQGQVIRILPLGDSITQGGSGTTTYRLPLYQKLLQAGVSVDFVGSRNDFCLPARAVLPFFDCDHEGHGGWRAQDLLNDCTPGDPCSRYPELTYQGDMYQWSRLYQADVALVHIGTNDVLQRTDPFAYLIHMWLLIDALRANNPTMQIYLAQILPAIGRTNQVVFQNFMVWLVAILRTTPESPITLVDMFNGYNVASWTLDGIHPTPYGDEWMAQRWFEALGRTYQPR